MTKAQFAVLVAAVAVTACTTASKRAGEYMEKGLYDDAMRTYEDILRRNPNDTDAAAGLRAARSGWIGKRLIDVRMTRLAGNQAQALDMLLDIQAKEAQWGSAPAGNVGFTQSEEISYGIGFLDKSTADSLAQKLPLKAEVFLIKYAKLFAGSEQSRRYDQDRARTKEAGKASCKELHPAPALAVKHPYYYSFLQDYCEYWGEKTPDPSETAEKYREGYFDQIQASAQGVTNLPADVRAALADATKAAFERTAWYDSSGTQNLAVNIGGGYTMIDTRVPQFLQYVYTEQVPYTVYVDVQKSRTVSYTENGLTKYRTETYTQSEPETRTRDVQRTYPYRGFQHDRKLILGLSTQLTIEKRPLDVELSETAQSGGIEHDENQPAIGLRPQHPPMVDPPGWLKAQSASFSQRFEQKLATLWREVYCGGAPGEDIAVAGDAVQHCLRQKMSDPPSFAQNWYHDHFGVSVQEADTVLGDQK
jgi:hypothetical protein